MVVGSCLGLNCACPLPMFSGGYFDMRIVHIPYIETNYIHLRSSVWLSLVS